MNLEIQCEKLQKLYASLQQLFTMLFIEEIEKEGEENGRLELEKTFEKSKPRFSVIPAVDRIQREKWLRQRRNSCMRNIAPRNSWRDFILML
uniref:Uncharacterized protein n=1 Tax=Acrobeloides nanus TaxID=290746 RepID=A0A914CZ32_9BILA